MTPFWGRNMRRRPAYALYRPSCQAGISAARRRILSLFLFFSRADAGHDGHIRIPASGCPGHLFPTTCRTGCLRSPSDGHSRYRSVRAISPAWRRTSAGCEGHRLPPAPPARQKRILPEGSSRRPARPPPLPCPLPKPFPEKRGQKRIDITCYFY